MYQHLIVKAQEEIATVRSVIKTNENLRNLIQQSRNLENSEECLKIIEVLKQNIPTTTDWKIYDHCSAVTKLYAIYENFVENLIRDWLLILPKIIPRYVDLDEKIKTTHRIGVGKLLQKPKDTRYQHLYTDDITRGLFYGVSGEKQYYLLPEAFLFHEQNLRKDILVTLLTEAGIANGWSWIEKHRKIKNFVEEIRGGENTAESELKELIDYRNDAAHGGEIDDWLRFSPLLELCDFVESVCQALTELFEYKTIEIKEKVGQAEKVGKIKRWYPDKKAAEVKFEEINISVSVGDNFFLVSKDKYWCQSATIESLRINNQQKQEIQIPTENQISLQFDVDARKGLYLYRVQ